MEYLRSCVDFAKGHLDKGVENNLDNIVKDYRLNFEKAANGAALMATVVLIVSAVTVVFSFLFLPGIISFPLSILGVPLILFSHDILLAAKKGAEIAAKPANFVGLNQAIQAGGKFDPKKEGEFRLKMVKQVLEPTYILKHILPLATLKSV